MEANLLNFAVFHANICYSDLWYGESPDINYVWNKLSNRYSIFKCVVICDLLHDILVFNAL